MSIAPATEIVVSLMSEHADEQGARQLQDDPRTYIFKTTNITLPEEVSVAVAENSEAVVNLALPYYAAMEANSVLPLSDDDAASVDGGIGAIVNGLLTSLDIAKVAASAASESAPQASSGNATEPFGGVSWGLALGAMSLGPITNRFPS